MRHRPIARAGLFLVDAYEVKADYGSDFFKETRSGTFN